MNKKLNLVEKAVEIFDLSVEIENLNNALCSMFFSEDKDNEALVKMQDELFYKRCQFAELEKQYKAIEKEATCKTA